MRLGSRCPSDIGTSWALTAERSLSSCQGVAAHAHSAVLTSRVVERRHHGVGCQRRMHGLAVLHGKRVSDTQPTADHGHISYSQSDSP